MLIKKIMAKKTGQQKPSIHDTTNAITLATYPFRYPGELEFIKQQLLPNMIAKGRISIVVIGPSRGDELATLAVTIVDGLKEHGKTLDDIPVELIGVELFPELVELAKDLFRKNSHFNLKDEKAKAEKMKFFRDHPNATLDIYQGDLGHPEDFSPELLQRLGKTDLIVINLVFRYLSHGHRTIDGLLNKAVSFLYKLRKPIICNEFDNSVHKTLKQLRIKRYTLEGIMDPDYGYTNAHYIEF